MKILALDIGGANLKAAHSQGQVRSVAFALWREPEKLGDALKSLAADLPAFDELRVTMTGELCDCFESKRQGVGHILDAAETLAAGRAVRVWATSGVFLTAHEARANSLGVAAANWHALGSYIGRRFLEESVVLVDIGSTTTDIILIHGGRPETRGKTDPDRLAAGELIYSGVRRTPVMALAPCLSLHGQVYPLMAELFATTADVHLLLGDLLEQPGCCQTADGQPMTVGCAARRLLRMIGGDMDLFTEEDARQLARDVSVRQRLPIEASIRRLWPFDRVVVSGSGEFLAARAAKFVLADRPEVPVTSLADLIGPETSVAACAYALLQLELPGGA